MVASTSSSDGQMDAVLGTSFSQHHKIPLEHLARVARPILNKIMVIKDMKTSLYKAYERKKQIYSKIA
jgi:hypothetical protein